MVDAVVAVLVAEFAVVFAVFARLIADVNPPCPSDWRELFSAVVALVDAVFAVAIADAASVAAEVADACAAVALV